VETAEGTQSVHKVSQRPLVSGDRVCLHTGAGGGYGPPERRDRALVEADLRAGYITPSQATDVYKLDKRLVTPATENERLLLST
jgi:N-methylhydantoinase B